MVRAVHTRFVVALHAVVSYVPAAQVAHCMPQASALRSATLARDSVSAKQAQEAPRPSCTAIHFVHKTVQEQDSQESSLRIGDHLKSTCPKHTAE